MSIFETFNEYGKLVTPVGLEDPSSGQLPRYAREDHRHNLSQEVLDLLNNKSEANIVDNPEFIIQQRIAYGVVGFGFYPVDRWGPFTNGASAASLVSTTSVLPNVTPISSAGLLTITTADTSITGLDYTTLQQNIEGFDFAQTGFGTSYAKDLTVSFWARASVAGTYCVSLRNFPVTRSYVREFNLEANVWRLVQLTFPACYDGTWATTSNLGAQLTFTVSCGPTLQTSPNTWANGNFIATSNQANLAAAINNTFYLTGVKLEVGNYSAYRKRPTDQELLKCKRYLQIFLDPPLRGVVTGATTMARCGMVLPVGMRVAPTLTATGTTFIYDGSVGSSISSINVSYMDVLRVEHDVTTSGGGFTTGRAATVYWNDGTGKWIYSAEL